MLTDVGRPKSTYSDFPENMTFDRSRDRFVVRNPTNSKVKRFVDETEARAAAAKLNELLAAERRARELNAGRPTVGAMVDKWEADRAQFMPWDERTRRNMKFKMARIRKELGARELYRTDCMFLEDWLGFCETADQFNKWRYALVLLWKFAVSRKLAAACEPEKIEKRSTSKKLESNRKVRQQLDLAGFWTIHAVAPDWLRVAMEQSLVTLQARMEICAMRHADYRDGYLYVIRDKTSGDSDMAFIRIAVTEQLEEIRLRSLRMPPFSPYLVHRRAHRDRREWRENRPHATYVMPEYLSKAFAAARDESGHYAGQAPAERPTFHEIRGLGARTYRAQGMAEDAIQALMTHAHQRTTQIYLERGPQALTDADFRPVVAPMRLEALR